MILFAKDIGSNEEESKFDYLATCVARISKEAVKFDSPSAVSADVAVSQFGDGLARVARRAGRNVFLFHDWMPNYQKYLEDGFDRAVFIGKFDHPDIGKSFTLESYPFDGIRQLKNDEKYPTLVTGVYEKRCLDWILGKIDGNPVRIACFDELYGGQDEDLLEMVDAVKQKCEVDFRPHAPLSLLFDYMGSASRILHCGGRRGLVHSAAVSTGKCESYTGDDSFKVARISALLPFLR